MTLSAENKALIEREHPLLFEDGFEEKGARFYPENLERLLNAARDQGRGMGDWRDIASAPLNKQVWGYRLDADKPWSYGVVSLVEWNDEGGDQAWFLAEDGEEIDAPVLWAPALIPSRPPLPAAPGVAGEAG